MKRVPTVLKLEAPSHKDVIRFLSSSVSVEADRKTSVVIISRTGTFTDPRYGEFTLSAEMFEHMVKNFNEGVFGQDIAIDVAHQPENGAAGFIRRLFTERNKLRAEVEWKPYGIDAVRNKGFVYLSAEIHPNFTDNEHQTEHGPTLLGAGVVVRPCIKNLDKIELAEAPSTPTYLSDQVKRHIKDEVSTMWEQLIKKLMAMLAGMQLSEEAQAQIMKLAQAALKNVTDQQAAEAVIAQVEETAKQLAEAQPNNVTLQLTGGGLGKDDITRLFSELQQQQQQQQAEAQQKLAAKVKQLTDAIDGAEGLSDEIKLQLKEGSSNLISADMSDDQIKSLAELQISHGQQQAANVQLQEMGFGVGTPRGVVQLTDTPDSEAAKLQGLQHNALRLSSTYANGGLALRDDKDIPHFVKLVLAEFDRMHAREINQAVLTLNGTTGAGTISDTNLPVGVQREVIREALSDLRVLELVQTLTDFSAQATTSIPYEERDISSVQGDGIVYEFGAVPRVKNRQKMDLAYVLPMKIAFMVSNELMHFSKVSQINWDAWARNISTAARTIREIVCRRLANEMQRLSDSYLAADVSGEDIAAQLDGITIQFKTAQFPIVRPFQQFDLQGRPIDLAENPITLVVNGTTIKPYDGTGKQEAGTYYLITNYNLGYLALVDEDGVPQTVNATTATIDYSYATNIAKVDSDVPNGVAADKHLNTILEAVGRRKALMKDDRFLAPDFLLMSNTLNDTCSNAEQFVASMKRRGSDVTATGDLDDVKSLPSWATNAPGIHLGDERILMGQRGALTYTIAKAFSLSEMMEARDENGQIIAGKEAYGEEYNAIHCPKPIRNRYTSVLFYSASQR